MTAKEFMRGIRRLQDEVRTLEKESQYWKMQSENISKNTLEPHYNPNRRTEASFAKCLEKYDEIQREIAEKVLQLAELRDNVNTQIESMNNPEERILLRQRYLNRSTWEEICGTMGLSRRTAFRIHGRALEKIVVPK